MEKVMVIVPAAGVGKRLGLGRNKAFADIGGVPLLVRCLAMLNQTELVSRVVVAVGAAELKQTEEMLYLYHNSLLKGLAYELVPGGKERQDSVANALACFKETTGYVAVHDGARPFAGREVFARTLAAAKEHGAAIAAVPLKDTVKVVDEAGFVVATPDRETLRAVQTPQIFEIGLLRRAYAYLQEHQVAVTDDASLVEALGIHVAVAEGSYENIKVTTPEDLLIAENLLEKQERHHAL